MEAIYKLSGWVKKVLNNENAKVLEEICIYAVGSVGKDTLISMANEYLELWGKLYPDKKRKYNIAYHCHVSSIEVCKNSGLLGTEKFIFSKIIKTGRKSNIKKTNK